MNNANSHFSLTPTVSIGRTSMKCNPSHSTTFNAGELVPIFLQPVLPGDTWSVDTSMLCRMSTMIHPVMGNAFIDVFWFYVPERLVWDHFKDFMGESLLIPSAILSST